jgi:hypothetical protein
VKSDRDKHLRHVEHPRDLLIREILEIAKRENLSRSRSELREGTPQAITHFAVLRGVAFG